MIIRVLSIKITLSLSSDLVISLLLIVYIPILETVVLQQKMYNLEPFPTVQNHLSCSISENIQLIYVFVKFQGLLTVKTSERRGLGNETLNSFPASVETQNLVVTD